MKGAKTGGRQKGTPNKVTAEVRSMIQEIVVGEYGRVRQAMQELQPRELVGAYIQLLRYVLPTLQSVGIDMQQTSDPLLERLKKLCAEDGCDDGENEKSETT